MKRTTLEALQRARKAGRALVRAIDLATGEERLVDPQGDRTPLGAAAADAARNDRSGVADVEGSRWFFEVHNPPLQLWIVGAVHIAQPLARMAMIADYRVVVIDPRRAFATVERFPGVRLLHDWPDEALAREPPSRRSALVALTHDPKIDDPALESALRSDCFYIGALGSKKTQAARLDRLETLGWKPSDLERIRGPVGLAIGARSPAEIAVSILAEMTLRLRADGGWERSVARATADTGLSPRS